MCSDETNNVPAPVNKVNDLENQIFGNNNHTEKR